MSGDDRATPAERRALGDVDVEDVSRPRSSLTWRTGLAGLALVAVAGCGFGSATPAPLLSPEETACQPSAGSTAGSTALIGRVSLRQGQSEAILLSAPVPGDASRLYVATCRVDKRGAVFASDTTAVAVPATLAGPVSVDAHVEAAGPPPEGIVGGRYAAEVVRVQVVVGNERTLEATLSGGYWLATWQGNQRATAARALDATGQEIGAVAIN